MSIVGFLGHFDAYNTVFSCYHVDPAFGFFLQPSTHYSFICSKFYFNYDFVYLQSPLIYISSYFEGLFHSCYIIAYFYCNNYRSYREGLLLSDSVYPGFSTLYREYWDYEGTDYIIIFHSFWWHSPFYFSLWDFLKAQNIFMGVVLKNFGVVSDSSFLIWAREIAFGLAIMFDYWINFEEFIRFFPSIWHPYIFAYFTSWTHLIGFFWQDNPLIFIVIFVLIYILLIFIFFILSRKLGRKLYLLGEYCYYAYEIQFYINFLKSRKRYFRLWIRYSESFNHFIWRHVYFIGYMVSLVHLWLRRGEVKRYFKGKWHRRRSRMRRLDYALVRWLNKIAFNFFTWERWQLSNISLALRLRLFYILFASVFVYLFKLIIRFLLINIYPLQVIIIFFLWLFILFMYIKESLKRNDFIWFENLWCVFKIF